MNLTLVVPNFVPAQYLNYSTEAITVSYPMLKFTRIFKYEVKIGVSYKTFGTISTCRQLSKQINDYELFNKKTKRF